MTLVDAAITVLDRDGVDAVSVRRVAAEVNYSRSGLMYRLGSMSELEREIAQRIGDELVTLVADVDGSPLRDIEWMEGAAARLVAWMEANPNRLEFLCGDRFVPEEGCPAVIRLGAALPGVGRCAGSAAVTNLLVSSVRYAHAVSCIERRPEWIHRAIATHLLATWDLLADLSLRPAAMGSDDPTDRWESAPHAPGPGSG